MSVIVAFDMYNYTDRCLEHADTPIEKPSDIRKTFLQTRQYPVNIFLTPRLVAIIILLACDRRNSGERRYHGLVARLLEYCIPWAQHRCYIVHGCRGRDSEASRPVLWDLWGLSTIRA
jgi:hypothetical protein